MPSIPVSDENTLPVRKLGKSNIIRRLHGELESEHQNGRGRLGITGECFQDPHSKNGSATGTGQDMTLGQASLSPTRAWVTIANVTLETFFFRVSSATNPSSDRLVS